MKKNTLWDIVHNLDVWVAGIALSILIVITFFGVIMRYVFSDPFVWLEEVQIGLFLWVVFLGGSAAFRMRAHVEISMLVDLFPKVVQQVVSIFIYFVVSGSLLYLGMKSSDMVAMFLRTQKSTSVLSIPSAFIYGIIPASALLMWISYTKPIVKDLMALHEIRKGGRR